MNSYTTLSFACLNVVDALYNNEDPTQAVQLLKELCLHDPVISTVVKSIPPTPLPNFEDTDTLYPHIREAIFGTSMEDNPNYLIFHLFTADNGVDLIRKFPNKMMISRGIINFALSLKDPIKQAPMIFA